MKQEDRNDRDRCKMGMKFEYKGVTYSVPCVPKKEWGEWMTSGMRCGLVGVCNNQCYPCKEGCIYGYLNSNARSAFYYECFPEEKPVEKPSCEECANYKPKEELHKLTQEVFEKADCPKWAKWAAVDESGDAYWYEKKPTDLSCQWCRNTPWEMTARIKGEFDASDWSHSLLEKASVACEKSCSCANYEPKKQILSVELPFKSPKLTDKLYDLERPEWAHWAAVDASGFGYWYERAPLLDTLRWSPRESSSFMKIQGSYDASDWMNSLVCIAAINPLPDKRETSSSVEEVLDPELLSWPTKWKYSQREELYYYKSAYQLSKWWIKYGEPQHIDFWVHDKIPADVIDVKCPLS